MQICCLSPATGLPMDANRQGLGLPLSGYPRQVGERWGLQLSRTAQAPPAAPSHARGSSRCVLQRLFFFLPKLLHQNMELVGVWGKAGEKEKSK